MNVNNNGDNLSLEELKQDNPKEYFRNILGDEDFIELDNLVKESNFEICWEVLSIDGVCEVKKGKLLGIYRPGLLSFKNTGFKNLGKLKFVKYDFYITESELESLSILSEIGGYMDLNAKNIKSIGGLEKVGAGLNIEGTCIELQLDVLEKLNNGKLKVDSCVYFGGVVEDIEKLIDKKFIPGNLNLQGLDLGIQFEVIEKALIGLLKVDGMIELNSDIGFFFDGKSINFDLLEEKLGKRIEQISNNHFKIIFISLLKVEYRVNLRKIIDKMKNVNKKDEIEELNAQLIILKEKIISFGIKIEEIDISDIINS